MRLGWMSKSWIRDGVRVVSRRTKLRAGSVVLLMAVGAAAYWQVVDHARPDGTTLGLLVLMLVGVLALADPGLALSLARRLKSLDAFGIKVELELERASRAAARVPEIDQGVDIRPRTKREPQAAVDEIDHEMRRKLRFVRKAIFGDPDSMSERRVLAKLESLGLLRADEARLCRDCTGADLRHEIDEWDEKTREEFLEAAWRFSVRLASETFDRYARDAFERSGWIVASFGSQDRHRRPDFLVGRDGVWTRTAARVAAPSSSIRQAAEHMVNPDPTHADRHLVVVPDYVDHLEKAFDDGAVSLQNVAATAARLRFALTL